MLTRVLISFPFGVATYTTLFITFGGFLNLKPYVARHKLLFGVLLSCLFSIKLLLPQGMYLPTSLLLNLAIFLLLFDNHLLSKVLCYTLNCVLLFGSEFISILILSFFGQTDFSNHSFTVIMVDLIVSVSYIFLSFLVHNIRLVFEEKFEFRLKILLFLSALALTLSLICMFLNTLPDSTLIQYALSPSAMSIMNTVAFSLPLLSLLGFLYLVHQLSISIAQASAARFEAYKNDLELQHFRNLAEKDIELRRFHHDLKNHLLTIDALGQSGNLDRQHQYISTISEAFVFSPLSISSGHLLIDSIMQTKARRMKEIGIQAQFSLCPLPDLLNISDPELCSLVGNILDNAIEACERFPDVTKTSISIALKTQGCHLCLSVINSALHTDSLLRTMQTISQKRNRHSPGLGLSNCQMIVNSYHGIFSIKKGSQENTIELTVILPCLPST